MRTEEFTKGVVKKHPVFFLMLGLCPFLAVSTSVENALGMSFAYTFVIISSTLIISAMRGFVPRDVRIPTFIVVISSLVTVIEFVVHGFSPSLYKALGVYLPLITVNCIVLGRVEAFASKNPVRDTFLDSLGMGVGFSWAIVAISAIRELIGTGKMVIFGREVVPQIIPFPALGMVLPIGAFLVLGVLLAAFKRLGWM